MNEPITKYELLKDKSYYGYSYRNKFIQLKKGESCEYFSHTDVYCFNLRDGYVPYFGRMFVEDNPNLFKPLNI
jgi:hypothetical protein